MVSSDSYHNSSNGTSQTLPATMRAAQLVAYNKPYQVTSSLAIPQVRDPRDVLIKVRAASYCFTDVEVARGMPVHGGCTLPIIPSHEGVGTIVSLGTDSDTTNGTTNGNHTKKERFHVGQRVGTLNHYHACGECVECLADPKNGYLWCQTNVHTLGLTMDGPMAEYLLADADHVFPLPDKLDDLDASALMCAGITIHKTLKRCNLNRGDWVGIIGAGGGLGHIGTQFAHGMGLNVVAIDVQDKALNLLKRQGDICSLVLDARNRTPTELRKLVVAATDPSGAIGSEYSGGCHAVIVLPIVQEAYDTALKIVRKHGTIVQVSVPFEGIKLDAVDMLFKDLTFRGSLYGTVEDAVDMLADAVKYGVKVEKDVYALEDVNQAVEDSKKGGKIVIDMDRRKETE